VERSLSKAKSVPEREEAEATTSPVSSGSEETGSDEIKMVFDVDLFTFRK
jgi:hypothetical protein